MAWNTAEVERIALASGFVVMDDDEILPITVYLGRDGEPCEPLDATVVVAGRDGYGWFDIDVGRRVLLS